jgi:hypothetical protein
MGPPGPVTGFPLPFVRYVTVAEFHGPGLPVCWNEEGLLNYSPIEMVVNLQTVSVALDK